jgi:hypothetical protein
MCSLVTELAEAYAVVLIIVVLYGEHSTIPGSNSFRVLRVLLMS